MYYFLTVDKSLFINLGVCECSWNYVGVDCSIPKYEPPIVTSLSPNGICDLHEEPCGMTVITGDNFLYADTLTCRITYGQVM